MKAKDYLQQSERTLSPDWQEQHSRLELRTAMNLLHACMGLCTEAAEFTDSLKKTIFYGKPVDKVNLKEEIGDLLWYCALALRELDSDFETEMQRNIDKLKVRFPDKFTETAAEVRNLDKEYEVLVK